MTGKPGGLSAFDLQQELKEAMTELLEDTRYPNPAGGTEPPSVHIYDLPVPQTDDDTELSYMPYVLIRTNAGKISNWDSNDQIKELTVLLLIGIYNPDLQRTGSQDVMTIIQRIENYLGKKRRVGNFTVGKNFQWVLAEADTHPYYFGGITVTFEAPRVIKEDPLV